MIRMGRNFKRISENFSRTVDESCGRERVSGG